MAIKETIPSVETQIMAETRSVPVEGSLNIIVPVNSPSGPSEITRYTSIKDLYEGHGVSTSPSANDDQGMLQAASMLAVSPIWVVRTHDNRVFEGLTDKGERIYFDEENSIIRHRFDATFGFSAESFYNMYIKVGNVCIYAGDKPDITADEFIHIEYTTGHNTYDSFFKRLSTIPNIVEKVGTFSVETRNDGSYIIYTEEEITDMSANISTHNYTTISTMVNTDITPESQFTQENYFGFNGDVYYNEGVSLNANEYPGNKVALPFKYAKDQQLGSIFATYLLDAILKKNLKSFTFVNFNIDQLISGNNNYRITSNIDYLFTESDDVLHNIKISVPPHVDIQEKMYIRFEVLNPDDGSVVKSVYFTNNATFLEGKQVGDIQIVVDAYTCFKMVTAIEEELATIDADASLANNSTYSLVFNSAKVVDYMYNFESVRGSVNTSTCTDGNTVYFNTFANSQVNLENIRVDETGILIDGMEYIIGDIEPTLSTSSTVLSESSMTLIDTIGALRNALPSTMNSTYSHTTLSIFSTSDSNIDIKVEGLLTVKITDNDYSDVEDENLFAVKLKYNSKAKIAQFSYSYDKANDICSFKGTVNGKSYERDIQFSDSTRVDGYGISNYYQGFNDNFEPLEIVLLNESREAGVPALNEYESPLFGDSIPIPEPTLADLQTAIQRISSYDFTKWEIMLDGGFIDPASITAMDALCKKEHMILYSGVKRSKYPVDLIEFRNQCPASSWNTMLLAPFIKDSSLGSFSVWMSPCVQKAKSVVSNRSIMNEFNPGFGASEGIISGTPEFRYVGGDDPESQQNQLMGVHINPIERSKELDLTFIVNNITLFMEESHMKEENIVRMMNAAAHVGEVWLRLNTLSKFNNLKLRMDVVTQVTETIEKRLASVDKPYQSIEIICDETNGNIDGSTLLYVTGYLVPYGSVHHVKFLEVCKNLETNE